MANTSSSNSTSSIKLTMQDYNDYIARVADRERNMTQRIANMSDPLQAIPGIIENEGSSLKTIWASDSGCLFDGAMFVIILIPIVLGVIGHYVAAFYTPNPTGEELYDDFGNRIVEYPRMPIAYLQQTRKDMSAVRENRNSLAWLCHKWLISTNDVVQELHAPYPLEKSTLRTVPEQSGPAKVIANEYENLQNATLEWKRQLKNLRKRELRKKVEARRRAKPLHTMPLMAAIRAAAPADIKYLQSRVVKARRLWGKLNQWIDEWSTYDKDDEENAHVFENDSYWSSSETFSSDSGEHWKSYAGDARKWAKEARMTAKWNLEQGRKMYAAHQEMKKKADEQAALETEEASSKAAASVPETQETKSQAASSSTGGRRKTAITKIPLIPSATSMKLQKKKEEKQGKKDNDDKKIRRPSLKTRSSEMMKSKVDEASHILAKRLGKH